VDELALDGVNVDVEGLSAEHDLDYGRWVGELRAALRERLPEAQVSLATQANDRGAAMALAVSAAGADRIFLMGYDYHWEGSNAGATAISSGRSTATPPWACQPIGPCSACRCTA
jgi:spore germination protein YaaH